jgi:HEAT repeat protein
MLEKRRKLRQERTQAFETKEARQKAEKLQRLLADLDEPENHDFAIYQINRMGVEAIEALIETLLTDHDPDARYGSARALGQICNEHQVKALIKARATKALVTALEDQEPAVRYWSAHALGKCGSQTAVKPLAALLKDEHEGVRQQARRALEKIGGKHVQEIFEAQDSKGIFNWIRGK